jgi:hypothetical protein
MIIMNKLKNKELYPFDKNEDYDLISPDEFLREAARMDGDPDVPVIICEPDRVNRYMISMKKGDKFPPVAFNVCEDRFDGIHRATAAKRLGVKKIPVVYYESCE